MGPAAGALSKAYSCNVPAGIPCCSSKLIWLTAAIPVESPCCSCRLTRVRSRCSTPTGCTSPAARPAPPTPRRARAAAGSSAAARPATAAGSWRRFRAGWPCSCNALWRVPMESPYGESLWRVPMASPCRSCKLTRGDGGPGGRTRAQRDGHRDGGDVPAYSCSRASPCSCKPCGEPLLQLRADTRGCAVQRPRSWQRRTRGRRPSC